MFDLSSMDGSSHGMGGGGLSFSEMKGPYDKDQLVYSGFPHGHHNDGKLPMHGVVDHENDKIKKKHSFHVQPGKSI
jgi:hypothetical protein